ncbi:MAG: exodeoxyribonuclease VII large subunit [Bacteroidales bacterium]|nr:exodeoxyribonuclease VII large subunit [Bacteroidales bacterium]
MPPHPVNLYQLNQDIQKVIQGNLGIYWVSAEIMEIKESYAGHCYMELVSKDEKSDKIIARSRATIWSATYRMIKPYFESTTGQSLQAGLKIMVRATAEFHVLYGLSLNITDIEPTYTVGELAVRKQKILNKLEEEGVLDMNKETFFPQLIQRIAVVTSKTAAGWGDFKDQLINNGDGFRFELTLFPAVMQGDEAEQSIIKALDRIYEREERFDTVVIIRGGGSQTDLDCFNNYWLAYHVTQFPLPVITGIGHEQDESVVDLVAHTYLKTPTAVAEFLIDEMFQVAERLHNVSQSIKSGVYDILSGQKDRYLQTVQKITAGTREIVSNEKQLLYKRVPGIITKSKTQVQKSLKNLQFFYYNIEKANKLYALNERNKLNQFGKRIENGILSDLNKKKYQLDLSEEKVKAFDPKQVLKIGYSITMKDGEIVKNKRQLKEGEEIETILYKGTIKSTIKK